MAIHTFYQSGINKYLALGDSYTIGEGVQEAERFPHLVVSILRHRHVKVQDPWYIAATGWTTADLQSAIEAQEPLPAFDVVSLLIGVNDQYRHMDSSGYGTRFKQLLHKAVELAGNRSRRVFVLSIPDYSATPYVPVAEKERVRKEIDRFNSINKQITLLDHITYLDITPLTCKASGDPSLLAGDGLHYSSKEYWLWAQMLAPLVERGLGNAQ